MKTSKAAWAVNGFLFFAFLLANCRKEYSYEGGAAVFSFLNVNGACSNPLISGDYIIGSALGTANSVQLLVDVTTAGSYSLQTNSRSGILFSSSGSFSDTGVQTVILTATGRPDSTGSFVFIPALAESCSFNVEVTGPQVPKADYTFIGAPNACTNALVSGVYQKAITLTASNTITINVNVVSPGDYIIHTDTLDGISFYATGSFAQVGDQQATLVGSGSPDLQQNLQFTLTGNGFTTCTFPLTVENNGFATYVIASGVDHCVGLPGGEFIAGTPLNLSNTYTLTVYVTVAGNFTISTQAVNGITFQYSGTFTRLGTNFVTLRGTGIPLHAGSFTVTPEIIGPAPLGGKSCDFLLTVN